MQLKVWLKLLKVNLFLASSFITHCTCMYFIWVLFQMKISIHLLIYLLLSRNMSVLLMTKQL